MDGKVIISTGDGLIRYGYYVDGIPCELYIGRKEEPGLVGNIYAARVDRLAEGIHGAFLEFAGGLKAYLPLSKDRPVRILSPHQGEGLKGGQIILVQVVKEASAQKLPVADSRISIAGHYLVLTLGDRRKSISVKVRDPAERQRLKELMDSFPREDYGLIFRTNAGRAGEEEIRKEYDLLAACLSVILARADHAQARTLLYQRPAHWVSLAGDLPETELKEVVTDDPDIAGELRDYYGEDKGRGASFGIRYYQDAYPLSKLYRMDHFYQEAHNRLVYLKSGAGLVIDHTEAMTVIDVNSLSVIHKAGKKEDVYYSINLEACREIARQLRLRNISGIIVIDFINMKSDRHRDRVLKELRKCCENDRTGIRVAGFTALGLVEMTRTKTRRSLREQFKTYS